MGRISKVERCLIELREGKWLRADKEDDEDHKNNAMFCESDSNPNAFHINLEEYAILPLEVFLPENADKLLNISAQALDLLKMKPQKSVWMNWYKEACGGAGNFETRKEADAHSLSHRTHVLEIITEDGKPVDVKIHEVRE